MRKVLIFIINLFFLCSISEAFQTKTLSQNLHGPTTFSSLKSSPSKSNSQISKFPIDLTGKVAFIAGVSDSNGYGWAIAKELAAAGATITLGTWPPVMGIFEKSLTSGRLDDDMTLPDGSKMKIEKIYPLDATFDTKEDIPQEVKESKRYNRYDNYSIAEVTESLKNDFGNIDFVVHSLANGPEVTKPLIETSRNGYLSANSASAYSLVSLLQHLSPIINPGGAALSLTYIASQNVIPGYGGGMSSAKAALESDTKTLAWELGRKYGIRVNCISAGPLKSRAASAIGNGGVKPFIEYAIDYSLANSPLQQELYAEDIGKSALFILSPLARGITGHILNVDNGLNIMGHAIDSYSLQKT